MTPLVILITLSVCMSSLHAITPTTIGTATYYEHYTPSACFGGDPPPTNMVVAMHPDSFHQNLCGQELKAICIPGPHPCRSRDAVVVKIAHICPPAICKKWTDIALSKEAFAVLADPRVGTIDVNYNY